MAANCDIHLIEPQVYPTTLNRLGDIIKGAESKVIIFYATYWSTRELFMDIKHSSADELNLIVKETVDSGSAAVEALRRLG